MNLIPVHEPCLEEYIQELRFTHDVFVAQGTYIKGFIVDPIILIK